LRAKSLQSKPIEIANDVAKIAGAAIPPNATGSRKVVGRIGTEYFLLNAEEILAFQADGELVWIITSKQRFLATQSLRGIEERLAEQKFQRVHRNAIVNVDHVRKMSALSSQRWLITLSNSLQLTVSKRQAHNIRDILHW
jgi:two-component system LytT family response regulator